MTHNLYRKQLLAHYRHPHHAVAISNPTHSADTAIRSCGDRVRVTVRVESELIVAIGIETDGCALAVAGGSALADFVIGKKVSSVSKIENETMFTLLGGIRPSASRSQCALLALETLRSALLG